MKASDLQAQKKRGAGCLVFSADTGKFLLIRRSNYVAAPLTWGLPGGKVEEDERPSDAAKREVLEEIGFDIGQHKLRLIYTNETHAPRFKFYTYSCIVDKEFEPVLNWESDDYTWCTPSDLPSPLHWGVQQMINHEGSARILKRFLKHHGAEK